MHKIVIRKVIGITLIIIGVISGFIPIIQGWVFILAGLALLGIKKKHIKKGVKKVKNWLKKKFLFGNVL